MRPFTLCAIALLLAAALGAFLHYWRPWNPVGRWLPIAQLTTPTGDSVLLAQQRNPCWTEPYTVSLFVSAGEGTRWFYVDHESLYWSDAALTWRPESQDVVIAARGRTFGVLDPAANVLRRSRDGAVYTGEPCEVPTIE